MSKEKNSSNIDAEIEFLAIFSAFVDSIKDASKLLKQEKTSLEALMIFYDEILKVGIPDKFYQNKHFARLLDVFSIVYKDSMRHIKQDGFIPVEIKKNKK